MVSTVGMLAMYQKLIDHAKKSAADAGKTASKGAIQKTAEAIYDFIGNKIVDVVANSYNDRAREVSKNSQQNNSETVTNKHDKEISKEKYISPEEIQENIDLRLK